MISISSCLLVFIIAFVALSSAQTNGCKKDDCPKYTNERKRNGYVLRDYKASKWTKSSDCKFMSLFSFIGGANKQRKSMPMTRPVLSSYSSSGKCLGMSFYAPHNMQSTCRSSCTSLPQPTASTLSNVNRKQMTVAVKSFYYTGTFFTPEREKQRIYNNARRQLTSALSRDNVRYDPGAPREYAGYDGPFTNPKYYEVWIEVKN